LKFRNCRYNAHMEAIPLNVPLTLSPSLKWYALAKSALLFLILTSPLFFMGASVWWGIYFALMFFVAFPLWVYDILSYNCTSFMVGEEAVTINSGIVFKRSTSIAYKQVQNITTSRGPLAALFGFSKVSIWTASPSQIVIQQGNSDNRPAGSLVLKTENAEALKSFISSKH
jgi:membrane protein YdbS with pleckstrin-like domain